MYFLLKNDEPEENPGCFTQYCSKSQKWDFEQVQSTLNQ